jgi:hypothetical protein
MDRWQTYPIQFAGGLITNLAPLQQGLNNPGSATLLRNFEPSTEGGYRRIQGYEKWDTAQVTGSDATVRGVVEHERYAVAVVGSHVYRSEGSGWTQLTDNATYGSSGVTLGGTGKVRFLKHHFANDKTLIIFDGNSKPFRFDGTTFSQITTAPSEIDAAVLGTVFKNHMFVAQGATLVFSAPYSDSDFTPASGAGTIELDNEITGLASFREQLIVFTKRTIFLIDGSSIADFQVAPVTRDIGAVEHDTVQEVGGDLMFLGPDGLRLLSATQRNNDFGLGVVTKVIQPELLSFVNASFSFCSVVIRNKSQYRLLGYNSSYANSAARGIIATQYAQQGGDGMAFSETRGINAFVASSEYVDGSEMILFANTDGYVYKMDTGNSFDGANIIATFSTPHLPITDPTTRKTLYKATLYIDPQGSFDVSMTPRYDFGAQNIVQPGEIPLTNGASSVQYYGQAVYGNADYGGYLQYVIETQLVGSGKVVQFQFVSDSQDPPFSLDSLVIQYGQYGRR